MIKLLNYNPGQLHLLQSIMGFFILSDRNNLLDCLPPPAPPPPPKKKINVGRFNRFLGMQSTLNGGDKGEVFLNFR